MDKRRVVISGLTKALLVALGTGAVISVALAFPAAGILYKEFQKEKWREARRRGALSATIKRLERQELVSWQEKNGETILTLTEEGKKKVLRYNIDNLKIKNTKRDGWLRVIVFDIPENKKVAREMFREKLKEMGLVRLQRSVFVTPYDCKNEIDFLAHMFEVASHVHYILAKNISNLEVK